MTEATGGQRNRKNIQDTLEPNLKDFCPNSLDKMANLIAYRYHLSPCTVRYSYLPMFIDAGILVLCNGNGSYDLAYKNGNIGKNTVEESVTVDSEAEKINNLRKNEPVLNKTEIEDSKKEDFSSDLGFYSFIKSGRYEELSFSELKKKVNEEVKNERLKNSWIKQIEKEEEKTKGE